MGRLIDADTLPKYDGTALSAVEVARAVDEAPTVDAVEVVKCEDCKYCNDGRCAIHSNDIGMPESVDKDFFCKYGYRREENE